MCPTWAAPNTWRAPSVMAPVSRVEGAVYVEPSQLFTFPAASPFGPLHHPDEVRLLHSSLDDAVMADGTLFQIPSPESLPLLQNFLSPPPWLDAPPSRYSTHPVRISSRVAVGSTTRSELTPGLAMAPDWLDRSHAHAPEHCFEKPSEVSFGWSPDLTLLGNSTSHFLMKAPPEECDPELRQLRPLTPPAQAPDAALETLPDVDAPSFRMPTSDPCCPSCEALSRRLREAHARSLAAEHRMTIATAADQLSAFSHRSTPRATNLSTCLPFLSYAGWARARSCGRSRSGCSTA